jgi:hypothetical protein
VRRAHVLIAGTALLVLVGCGGSGRDTAAAVFESFRLSTFEGPCFVEGDCTGYTELLSSGILRVDRMFDTTGTVHEATVTPEDLDLAVAILNDSALVALLDSAELECNVPTDTAEHMTLSVDGVVHERSTVGCDQEPFGAAREVLFRLAHTYLP